MNLETVENATLLKQPTRVHGGNSAGTWKGGIRTVSGNDLIAYIKVQSRAETLADMCCAVVGRAAGLQIPRPFWVKIPRNMILGDLPPHPLFALEEADAISFKQWLRKDQKTAERIFSRWQGFRDTALFDEWIANTDRNLGNILYDGEFWLIDHAHAFGGPSWQIIGLTPDTSYTNLLLSAIIMEQPSQHERYQWRIAANASSLHYQQVNITQLKECVKNYGQELETVVNFLQQRTDHLVSLVCHRLNIPELLLN